MSRAFEARYYGRCVVCDERTEPGDLLVYEADETLHEGCADRSTPVPARPEVVCPSCWLVHAGECP